jgi:hypothetical protein
MITSLALATVMVDLIWRENATVNLSGLFENSDIRLSNCIVTGKGLVLRNTTVAMAGCKESFDGVDMEGGDWRSYPTAIKAGDIGKELAWWSATNGNTTVIGGDHSIVWPKLEPGNNHWTVTVQRDELKDGVTFDKYKSAQWKVRDGAGKVRLVTPKTWTPSADGKTVDVKLSLNGPMKEGPGFWSCTNPAGYTKGSKYNNFNVRNHRYFSVYFADGITVSNSNFGPATLDYNLGFENCMNVSLVNVKAWGNQTFDGNGASIAFLFGVDGLKAIGIETDSFHIRSMGWPVNRVDVDSVITWPDWDKGWFSNVKEQGVLRRDGTGAVVGIR